LELETTDALNSSDWLNIGSESILEFLDMECLNIKEADLVRALVRWGKFQLEQQDRDTLDEKLRSKILPGLRKIRFDSLTHLEVAELCKEEFGEVLTGDEKSSIFMANITGDWKLMPTDIVSSSKLAPRHEPYTICPLYCDTIPAEIISKISGSLSFNFQVDKKADIIGVKVNLPASLQDTLTSIKLRTKWDGEWTDIGTGDPKSTSLHRGEMFYKINAKQSLAANTESEFTFSFATSQGGFLSGEKACTKYILPKDKNPSCSDGLTLKVHNAERWFYVHIQGIVFKKVAVVSMEQS
jgi:hypothetical protein